jgi:hypothetical protein
MSPADDIGLEPYRHPGLGFELPLPAGWERRDNVDGCAVVAVEPAREDGHFCANAVVTVERRDRAVPAEDWVRRSREALAESLNRLRVIDLESTELAGLPAERTLAHYVHPGFGGVTLEQWALAHGEFGYVLSCSGAALENDDLADLNRLVAAGLRLA